jgi:hypothetical protein
LTKSQAERAAVLEWNYSLMRSAVEVGDKLWVSSTMADRIAIIPFEDPTG